jgi:hypothetical protein
MQGRCLAFFDRCGDGEILGLPRQERVQDGIKV